MILPGTTDTKKISQEYRNKVYVTSNGNEFTISGSLLACKSSPIFDADAQVALHQIDTNTDIKYLVQTTATLRGDGKYGPPSRIVALPTKEYW